MLNILKFSLKLFFAVGSSFILSTLIIFTFASLLYKFVYKQQAGLEGLVYIYFIPVLMVILLIPLYKIQNSKSYLRFIPVVLGIFGTGVYLLFTVFEDLLGGF